MASLFGRNKRTDIPKTIQEQTREAAPGVIDFLAPEAVKLESNFLQLENRFLKTLFVFSYPRYLETNWFTPIINLDQIFDVAMHIHPADTALVLKQLRKKVTEVAAQVSEREEKGLIRDPSLETAYKDLEELRDKLSQARERLFRLGFYITIYGETKEELAKAESTIKSILEAHLIYIRNALFQQDAGFVSTLPIGSDKLATHTPLNTAPLSTAFPFVSFDLTSSDGILYGINRHNNSLILFDRFSLENAHMVVFAKSGSGKSYASKLEILRQLMMGIDIVIIDPENEYQYLAETVGGAYFKVSLTSPTHLNPFDLPPPIKGETTADTLRSNIINLVGLFRIMLGGLTAEEDSLIDQAIIQTYASRDITPDSDLSNINPPTLLDFEKVLSSLDGSASLATRLKKYTQGAYAGFLSNLTNVGIDNQLVVFSIRDLEAELRPVAMFVIIHFIWNLVRGKLKKRLMVIDEAWWLMQHEDGASFVFGIAKRARKYYLGLTTITQDVADFMESRYGKAIITNSSMQLLLKQSPPAAEALSKIFNLTEQERFLLLECDVGEGIFFAGQNHVAVKVIASYTEDQIITSDPAQLLAIQKAKQELAQAVK
ncbi:DUF87 domain-containing protein [Candidatus Parcubacteria bacterium]|nr:MAG: DUF87 domain-containing protein [Candidatus Parcubacteria bacterium]